MKITLTPRFAVALALCSAVLPLGLAGCGGGNGGLLNPPPPKPPAGDALPVLNFTFNSGQTARFFNGTVSPTGVVNAQITITGAAAAPLQIPPGTYPAVGTLNPTTRDFTLTQGPGSSYNFSVAGKVPSATDTGNFVFTAQNGATENGTFQAGTVIIPPGNGTYTVFGDVKFSSILPNTTAETNPINSFSGPGSTASLGFGTDAGQQTVRISGFSFDRNFRQLVIRLDTTTLPQSKFEPQQRIVLGKPSFGKGNFVQLSQAIRTPNQTPTTKVGNYVSESGTAIISAVSATAIIINLENVVFVPESPTGTGGFTITNSSLGANGLQTRNEPL